MTIKNDIIYLVVKTPNLDISDQYYECNAHWTVKDLKVHLSSVYPTKPSVNDQRLIYFGRFLFNNSKLRDALNITEGNIHTIHLVSPPKKDSSDVIEKSKCQDNVSTASNTESIDTAVSVERNLNVTNDPNINQDYLRSNYYGHQIPYFQVPSVSPGLVTNPTVITQQVAAMQQMYSQYMTQYFQYMQSVGRNLTVPQNQSPPQDITPERQPEPIIEENIQNRPAVIEERAVNRDLLDYIYILTRLGILLSVIYIYSSLTKCLFVIGLGIIIYIYRKGYITFGRQRNRNDARQHPVISRRHGIRHRSAAGVNRLGAANELSSNNASNARSNGTNQVTTVKTFITSFFSSLIPDQVNPANVH